MNKHFFRLFQNPPACFRPASFWSLNGDLNSVKLSRQIKEFKKLGYGGFFMHPRPGMKTLYLEKKWFNLVKFMCRAGKNSGMEPWLYDEDSYPSGFAAGKVPAWSEEYRSRSLYLFIKDKLPQNRGAEILCTYTDGKNNYLIAMITSSAGNAWFNRQSYIDTFNPEAVKKFIALTHEAYLSVFKNFSSAGIPGIFTDEPHHRPDGVAEAEKALPWTDRLPVLFKEKYQYDLQPLLPELFFEIGNFRRTRYHFFSLVNELFCSSFAGQIYDWCCKNHLEFTGHYWEHCFPDVLAVADPIAPLKYMQRPGIDLLGRNMPKAVITEPVIPRQTGNIMMIKMASSAAHQYGRKRTLCEIWGGAGWGESLADLRQTADWAMLLGMNYLVPHLSHYSLAGYRKRDWPPSFTGALTYTKQLRLLYDYIARICCLLSESKSLADILVILPVTDNWLSPFHPRQEQAVELEKILRSLLLANYNFDLGSEALLSADGRIENKKLILGQAEYSTVIVPPCGFISPDAAVLLDFFCAAGGNLILTGEPPLNILTGLPVLNSAYRKVNPDNLNENLAGSAVRPARLSDFNGNGIMTNIRQLDGNLLIFAANFDQKERKITIQFTKPGRLELLDAFSGQTKEIFSNQADAVNFSFTAAVGESNMFIYRIGCAVSKKSVSLKEQDVQKPGMIFTGSRIQEYNALVLDLCRYRLENKNPGALLHVEQAKKEIFRKAGYLYSNFQRYPREYSRPWNKPSLLDGKTLELFFDFSIEDIPDTGLFLASEYTDGDLFLNGRKISKKTGMFFLDDCYTVYDVADLAVSGQNLLKFNTELNEQFEPENFFLLGKFSADEKQGSLKKYQAPVLGNIAVQGMPFYGGRVSYDFTFQIEKNIKEALIAPGEFQGISMEYRLDGKSFMIPPGFNRPLPCGVLKRGTHKLTVIVHTGLRNLLGPLHYDETANHNVLVTPWCYLDEDGKADKRGYVLMPRGLFTAPCIFSS
ncbi:MAG: hypothetical protein A2096_01520 [Spirochaetes bacterium GWF1_41_5]|nr:MAG: hypothetical protein A2096_01520 [Spirochaetes bacterium GWF1_41_5]HBE02560.1 hypothetical protein [Spirochaetia bacterium]